MPEETTNKLRKIIEAQVRGDYRFWSEIARYKDMEVIGEAGIVHTEITHVFDGTPVICILLDPQGLRAAYGSIKAIAETGDRKRDILLNAVMDHLRETRKMPQYWENAAVLILNTWLSSDGDAEKTISTAFELLPKATPSDSESTVSPQE